MSNSPYPILLTPGPLTTSARTKEAMLRDWGSWDADFNQITARLREQIVRIVHGEATHVCVPLQGSGTFSVEAAIGTIVPRDGHVLVPSNGAYCQRIARICKYLGRRHTVIDYTEDRQVLAADVDLALTADPSITHVALVHCETGAGVLHGKGLIVDAMSSFGAIEIDARKTPFDAVIAASGKCLEGVPGMGFVILRRSMLEKCEGNCHSLALDLYDQWVYMEKTTQWRYTPPTHVVAALDEALRQYWEEGGLPSRGGGGWWVCVGGECALQRRGWRGWWSPWVCVGGGVCVCGGVVVEPIGVRACVCGGGCLCECRGAEFPPTEPSPPPPPPPTHTHTSRTPHPQSWS